MPNHIANIIKACGPDTDAIFKYISNGDKVIDFDKIAPEPDKIKHEDSRYMTDASVSWRRLYWGTKWNAYDQKRINDFSIEFSTAWNHPFPIIKKISQLYPTVEFFVRFASEDLGYDCGSYTMTNGEIISKNILEYSRASVIFAAEMNGLISDIEQILKDREL